MAIEIAGRLIAAEGIAAASYGLQNQPDDCTSRQIILALQSLHIRYRNRRQEGRNGDVAALSGTRGPRNGSAAGLSTRVGCRAGGLLVAAAESRLWHYNIAIRRLSYVGTEDNLPLRG